MNRRHAHGRPTPSLTPDRDEGVRPACVEPYLDWRSLRDEGVYEPWAYDVLHDSAAGWGYRRALKEATDMRETCPLRAACLTDPENDLWATGIRAELKRRAKEAAA